MDRSQRRHPTMTPTPPPKIVAGLFAWCAASLIAVGQWLMWRAMSWRRR